MRNKTMEYLSKKNNNNERITCLLIDFRISVDKNVIKKRAVSVLRHKDRATEIQRTRNVKTP